MLETKNSYLYNFYATGTVLVYKAYVNNAANKFTKHCWPQQ